MIKTLVSFSYLKKIKKLNQIAKNQFKIFQLLKTKTRTKEFKN